MKRIVLCIILLLNLTLFIVGCSHSKKNPNTITLPVISLKSTEEEINARYYEHGFDFNYDALPTLELVGSEDVLEITLPDEFSSKVVIGDNYYTYTENTGSMYNKTHELEKDDNNVVLLPINRLGNVKDETSIYYIAEGESRYVFQLILPVDQTG